MIDVLLHKSPCWDDAARMLEKAAESKGILLAGLDYRNQFTV